MVHSYSTEAIAQVMQAAALPFSDVLARALVALLTGRRISLHEVAHRMPGEQNPEANRMQLRRCLDHATLTAEVWARVLATLLPARPWILALDRTEWKRGKTTINLLVLAIVAFGCAVPLLWSVLPNPGASNTKERIELVERFLALFGRERSIRFLTADREFIGGDWLQWLRDEKIPFRIRIKAGERLLSLDGTLKTAREWFAQEGCPCPCLPNRMLLWCQPVFVGGKPLKGDEYLIVISSEPGDLLTDYKARWNIETLFQALKGRGFDLESCHLPPGRRLSGWFGFLSLALLWCLKVGEALERDDLPRFKKHGRRAESVFKRGWRHLQALLACLSGRPAEIEFFQAVEALCSAKC